MAKHIKKMLFRMKQYPTEAAGARDFERHFSIMSVMEKRDKTAEYLHAAGWQKTKLSGERDLFDFDFEKGGILLSSLEGQRTDRESFALRLVALRSLYLCALMLELKPNDKMLCALGVAYLTGLAGAEGAAYLQAVKGRGRASLQEQRFGEIALAGNNWEKKNPKAKGSPSAKDLQDFCGEVLLKMKIKTFSNLVSATRKLSK